MGVGVLKVWAETVGTPRLQCSKRRALRAPVPTSQTSTFDFHSCPDSASPILSCFLASVLCRCIVLEMSRMSRCSWLCLWCCPEQCFYQMTWRTVMERERLLLWPGQWGQGANEGHSLVETPAVWGWALYQYNWIPHPALLHYWDYICKCLQHVLLHLVCSSACHWLRMADTSYNPSQSLSQEYLLPAQLSDHRTAF